MAGIAKDNAITRGIRSSASNRPNMVSMGAFAVPMSFTAAQSDTGNLCTATGAFIFLSFKRKLLDLFREIAASRHFHILLKLQIRFILSLYFPLDKREIRRYHNEVMLLHCLLGLSNETY